ncbi:MAG: hypothetical protein KAH16_01690 [Candidatus Izimaplasma sp.]|nr:hypothetical protein [Candidatus Izimaplasma bacterium]
MKKIVFLLCFIIFTIPMTIVSSYGNNEIYSFGDYDIIVSDYTQDDSHGISIEKTGVDPFYTVLNNENESYIINGVIKTNTHFIVFGSNHIYGNDTYYDSMFLVLDQLGNIVNQITFDYEDLEEIVGAYFIDNVLILHTVKSTDDGMEYKFVTNYFSSYDLAYNLLNTIEINTDIKKISSNEEYILFNYEYDDLYDGAIRDDLSIMLPTDIINISNNQIFIDEVTIEFLNSALLNNEIVQNGITIDYPGNYKLVYNNSEYNFVVMPIVSGIEDNKIYNECLTPKISAGNIMLNNDIYISGTEINIPGNYELIITGINNYTETYHFTITSNMDGIINNHIYLEPVVMTFNGEGYLNNQYVESPIEVTDDGEYILKIKGENNYLETYYFQIEEDVETMTIISFIQKFDIFILVVVLISGGIILKKK